MSPTEPSHHSVHSAPSEQSNGYWADRVVVESHCGSREFFANLSLTIDATLITIPGYTTCLNIHEMTNRAIAHFESDCTLPGILLEENQKFVGMVSRQRLYQVMSRPFSLELFPQRSLQTLWQILNVEMLVMDAHLPITLAVHRALQRPPEDIYEPIIIKISAHQYGVIDVHTLLLAQNHIHEVALREIQANKRALQEERDLAQITLKSIVDGVITTDAIGRIQEMNPVAEMITGWHQTEASNQSIASVCQFLDRNAQQPIVHPVEQVLQQRVPTYSLYPAVLSHHDRRWEIEYSASPIFGKEDELLGAILVLRDVSRQQELLRKIHWQASHDGLTGLLNRSAFEDQLAQCVTQTDPHSDNSSHVILYLDLDRFKAVNDTCGHFAGDELLRQVGMLLQESMREKDLLARLGGDEFGSLLYNCDAVQGRQIADRIYQSIQDFRFIWEDYVFTIGVSIGLAVVDGLMSAAEVLRQADSACYLAKYQGRNQICAYLDIQPDVIPSEPTQWVKRLTEALTHSRFQLFHQQIFSSSNNYTPFCSEILLRLPTGHNEWLSPSAFLHTAERYNLMTEIDAWVVRSFCEQYDQISTLSETNLFAINLSGASLNSPRLSTLIRSQFEAHNIPPQNVCFEITETVAIANLTRARSLLQELKDWGCYLALDDFGNGMSSFHYLRSLPVDYLKIDGALIRDVVSDRVACEMVTAINNIGHEMGLKTIAEWVENDTILRSLQDLQIDYVQGQALHIPAPLFLSSAT